MITMITVTYVQAIQLTQLTSEALLYKPLAANNIYLTAVITMPDYVMLSVDYPPGT